MFKSSPHKGLQRTKKCINVLFICQLLHPEQAVSLFSSLPVPDTMITICTIIWGEKKKKKIQGPKVETLPPHLSSAAPNQALMAPSVFPQSHTI